MQSNRVNNRTPIPPAVPAIIRLMNELVELMTAEPELVMGRKFDEHKELLKRKQKLTLEYRAVVKSIAAQPDMLKTLPEDVRRVLKTATQKLNETAERNARTLRSAVTAVQRLIQNIIGHIKTEVLTKPGYKNPNTAYLELGNYSPTSQTGCRPAQRLGGFMDSVNIPDANTKPSGLAAGILSSLSASFGKNTTASDLFANLLSQTQTPPPPPTDANSHASAPTTDSSSNQTNAADNNSANTTTKSSTTSTADARLSLSDRAMIGRFLRHEARVVADKKTAQKTDKKSDQSSAASPAAVNTNQPPPPPAPTNAVNTATATPAATAAQSTASDPQTSDASNTEATADLTPAVDNSAGDTLTPCHSGSGQ